MTAEHSGLARAAELVHLMQPGVSVQMAQFSESLGIALFEKRRRSVALTRAGETMVPYLQRVPQTLRETGEAIDALRGLPQGQLRIVVVTRTR